MIKNKNKIIPRNLVPSLRQADVVLTALRCRQGVGREGGGVPAGLIQ